MGKMKPMEKFQITPPPPPPQVWVSGFPCANRNRISLFFIIIWVGNLKILREGGKLVIWNISVQSILIKWQPFFNFFIMADADILFPSTLENWIPKLLRVSDLELFCMIDINKMAGIFRFLHNGQCWYSISANTPKTGYQNFWVVGNLEFFHWLSFPHHPTLCLKAFMHGDLCVVTFLHYCSEKFQKICKNILTHLWVAVVDCLGNSDESSNIKEWKNS